MGWFSRKPTKPVLLMDGKPKVGVRGPRFYSDTIAPHVKKRVSSLDVEESLTTWVALVPQPDNEWVENAVAVLLDGRHIGHLPEGKLTDIGNRMLEIAGDVTLMTVAEITWNRRGDTFYVNVALPAKLADCEAVVLTPMDQRS